MPSDDVPDEASPAVSFEDLQDVDLSGYESDREFALDLGVAIARAHNSDEDVIDEDLIACTLERWRATMTGRVVLPITLSPKEAQKRRDEFDQRHGQVAQVQLPISDKLIHDLDTQIEHINNIGEAEN